MPYPDFLGIGPPKSGTSWLDAQLRLHPQIHLPYIKEIHYFDEIQLKAPTDLVRRLFHKRNKRWRKAFVRTAKKIVREKKYGKAWWCLKLYLKRRNDIWYRSLFYPESGQITGEITPLYHMLLPKRIEHVHRLMPNAKIIVLLRNPVDRLWSSTRMIKSYYERKQLDNISNEEYTEFFSLPWHEHQQSYLRNIKRWQLYYPQENIFVGFLDEIIENPEDFLLRIFDFLNVEVSTKHIAPNVADVVNKGPDYPMPAEIRIFLTKKYFGEMKALHEYFGGRATKWYEDAKELLAAEDDV